MHLPTSTMETRSIHEMHALDDDSSVETQSKKQQTARPMEVNHLDECIDAALSDSKDMFSIANLIRSQANGQPVKRQKTTDLRPITYVRFNTRAAGKPKPVTLRALLDSGGSGSLVTAEYAKKLKMKKSSEAETVWTTPAGELKTTKKAKAQFLLAEFHDDRLIEWNLHVTKNLGAYDMIIGRDILEDLGLDIRFSTKDTEWDGASVPFKDVDDGQAQSYHINDSEAVEEAVDRLKDILDAKYQPADLDEIAREQKQLDPEEQRLLRDLLEKYKSLFDGTLGHWKDTDYKIDLKEGAKPYHAKAYPIPHAYIDTLKLEVDRLVKLGVLKKVNRSEWAAPTFIIPKKDKTVRFISDFRELNKRISRKPYPIPKIQDLLLKLEGFQYATSLDLNMGYYHIELNPDSKKLCTIVLPFGKYEYQRLPMGLSNSPDIFQEKMSDLMEGLEFVRTYIDDLLCITKGSFQDHLNKLELVLNRLQKAGLKVNATKSFFAAEELEYLGYWINRNGIQPLPKKVQAIQRIAEPKNVRELRGFIGVINYYRDMWIRRSHVLAPLAALTSKKVKWHWGDEERKAFQDVKKIIAREVMLSYPDFSKPFVIHTDASHFQLGAVISQDGKPIAFYSRKLNAAQARYTTTERELLSIVETLKEYRNILLGQKIVVHTDHKNLVYKHFNTERVMRWRLLLEEYGPELQYIKGEKNIVADALSRLEMMSVEEYHRQYSPSGIPESFAADDGIFPMNYPLSYKQLRHEQQRDQELQSEVQKNPDKYKMQSYRHSDYTYELITCNARIVVPKDLRKKTVEWYHSILLHPGETRTELTIAQHYYWKGMRETVKQVCSRCPSCQKFKTRVQKYGHLPEKEPDVIPWHTVHMDTIGPYKIGEGKEEKTLICLTMIDPATGWFEIVETPAQRADIIANLFETTWLTRYPWPTEVIIDKGKEFMREVKELLSDEYGIQRKPITTCNPQANAMVERAHKTLKGMINTQEVVDALDKEDPWTGLLSSVGFAMRSTVHTTNRATPAQLVFGRDAMLNVSFEADWQFIKERKQKLIRQNNKRENAKRMPYTYQVNDQVLVERNPNRKYGEAKYKGPYRVTRVYDNGTVRLLQSTNNGGAVYQTWNIRRLTPYKA